jgi:hypothetical protein
MGVVSNFFLDDETETRESGCLAHMIAPEIRRRIKSAGEGTLCRLMDHIGEFAGKNVRLLS